MPEANVFAGHQTRVVVYSMGLLVSRAHGAARISGDSMARPLVYGRFVQTRL